MFPEYCSVLEMMRNPKRDHELYKPYPDTIIKEIKSVNGKHVVTVQNLLNEEISALEVSYCGIFIGSRPDLQLLNSMKPAQNQLISNHSEFLAENIFLRTSKRLKLFCEKFRHLNLCRVFSKRSSNENVSEESTEVEVKETEILGFCEDTSKPLDVRNNVLAVDKYNQLLNVPKGVYACGPLVGDNFVRFIPGSAILICSDILKEI